RENPDRYRKGAANKQYDPAVIDQLLDVDKTLRELTAEREQLTAEQNRIGKSIGQLAGQIKKADDANRAKLQADMKALQARPNEIKAQVAQLTQQIQTLEPQRDALWLQVPQPADDDVPVGKSADDNTELRQWSPPGYDLGKSF